MDSSLREQVLNLIEKSNSILLLTHAKADCDGLGSMLSMYLALQSLGKEVVAATNDPAPDALGFLPSIQIVQNSVASKNFVITLDISKTPLNKIKYKLAEDHSTVNIIVTPKEGHYKPSDVKFDREAGNFDLIITFDTGNLEHLGPIYDQNAEIFFKTPVINIDHHTSNTDYGQINYVDVVAASTTEVLLEILEDMEKKYDKIFLNEDVATLLLAGLITDTGSFQHSNTSPRAMEVAAKLLDMGARQQEIIKNIYKTKPLTQLKLWGTVLSKVETDPIYRMVWSSVSKNDLLETGASSEESEGIIDDLLSNAPGAEIIMLFKYNNEGYVSVSMRSTTNSADVGKICADMGGGGHIRAAGFKRRDGSSLEKLIDDTLMKVREYQGRRLNIHPEDVKILTEGKKEGGAVLLEIGEKGVRSELKTEKSTEPTGEKKVQYLDFKAEKMPTKKPGDKEMKQPGKEEKKAETPATPKKETAVSANDPRGRRDRDRSKKMVKAEDYAPRQEGRPENRPTPQNRPVVQAPASVVAPVNTPVMPPAVPTVDVPVASQTTPIPQAPVAPMPAQMPVTPPAPVTPPVQMQPPVMPPMPPMSPAPQEPPAFNQASPMAPMPAVAPAPQPMPPVMSQPPVQPMPPAPSNEIPPAPMV